RSPEMSRISLLTCLGLFVTFAVPSSAEEPLHKRIDQLIAAKAAGKPVSALTDDAEFLRRASLDLAGKIPSIKQTREFLVDKSPDKRVKLIDQLVASSDYPKRMTDVFHVMLMERMGDAPAWRKYLSTAFAENRPWDKIVREILKADHQDAATLGSAFFIAKRLDKVGQQTTDYPGLTRDVGRLFLGKNFQCAQCHDHLFVDEYKQEHFQGIFAYLQNVYIVDMATPSVAENLTTAKVNFMSVFKKVPKEIGPALPGGKENVPPVFKKGEEFVKAPDPKKRLPGVPKFSTLALLSEQLPSAENKDFSRNIANRLWFVVMGRGLVHPLDLHHKDNPASHPELLELLAKEFVAHKFDIRWMIRELALTETYQRSSILPKGADKSPPELFLTAIEKRVSAEQLFWSMLEASGERERILASRKPEVAGTKTDPVEILLAKFQTAFANPAREPEEEFNPSLKAALFVLNDSRVLDLLTPKDGNLVDRLAKMTDDAKVAEDLYLSVLTRLPSDEEKSAVSKYLAKNAAQRPTALGQLAWALFASTEFSLNH
ncbi:MAG: DUF1549 and DUF1553 domain-containing protein, partial [Planctomycetes bacterium]|nr:DUF1549 and DUF1553 domain-containing protein [Planctomycetota bacterium]